LNTNAGASAPIDSTSAPAISTTTIGKVYKKVKKRYWVRTSNTTVVCIASSKLHKVLIYPEADRSSRRRAVDRVAEIEMVDPIAVGDQVSLTLAGDGSGMITEVLPRRNQLSRRQASGPGRDRRSRKGALEQVIVANVDQLMVVTSAAQPKPSWRLVDRFLADAELVEIPVVICITKCDLRDPEELRAETRCYIEIGYPVLLTSALDGIGIDALAEQLQDRTSVLMGKSGVGKSSLLNALQPDLGLAVQAVSERIGKGKHTTSHLEMFQLQRGGFVVDTPGMKEFASWSSDLDLAYLFREMQPLVGHCRFGLSCTHVHEPDCRIKEAVAAGTISARRYDSFLRMSRAAACG
jgi:ribosome biogenesis GTPase